MAAWLEAGVREGDIGEPLSETGLDEGSKNGGFVIRQGSATGVPLFGDRENGDINGEGRWSSD